MTLSEWEALAWSQVRNLNNRDPLIAKTAMAALRAATLRYAEDQAGRIVAARRRPLEGARHAKPEN